MFNNEYLGSKNRKKRQPTAENVIAIPTGRVNPDIKEKHAATRI